MKPKEWAIMKKWKVLLSAIAMMLAVGMFTQTAYAAEDATVHKVDDISDVSGLTADVYQVGEGKYEETIKFHLDKPAEVYLKGSSNVATDFYNLGTIEHFAVYSDEACTNMVSGDKDEAIWFEEVKEKFLSLDAGDYWVKVAKANEEGDWTSEEDDAKSSGQFTLIVAAQYLDVDATKNTSKTKAQKISVNKDVTGFLSSTTRNSWFTFDVKTDNTIVNFGMSLKNAFEGKEGYEPDYTGFIVYDSKDNIVANCNIESEYNNTVFDGTYAFKKGTYYVKFTGDSAWDDWGDLYELEVNNKGVVNLHVTAVEVPTVKSWKNTGKSKAKVAYNKVTLPEGYEVQYAANSDFSDAKITKVKANKAKAAISKLKKGSTYYVRVRAWSYDVFDEVVYGNWSAVKSVKITK